MREALNNVHMSPKGVEIFGKKPLTSLAMVRIPTEAGDVMPQSIDVVEEATSELVEEIEVNVLPTSYLLPNTSTNLVMTRPSEPSSPKAIDLMSLEYPNDLPVEMDSTTSTNPSLVNSTENVVVENTEALMVEE